MTLDRGGEPLHAERRNMAFDWGMGE